MAVSNRKKAVGAAAGVALAISALIKPWEGLELRSYPDIVGVWTICYGETKGVRPGQTSTKAECEDKLLTRVVNDYYYPLTLCVPDFDRKPVGWQAAMISLTYNVGVGAACKSTAARLAREGRIADSCRAMTAFNKAGGRVVQGLVNRRSAELKVCLSST